VVENQLDAVFRGPEEMLGVGVDAMIRGSVASLYLPKLADSKLIIIIHQW